MDLLIRNATIVPMTGEQPPVIGDIAIQGGKIVACGPSKTEVESDQVIDATGMIAMPGLVNAHTHLSMTFFRNYQDTVSDLHDWLSKIWPLEDRLTRQDVLVGSRLALAEAIMSGTTCVADMYFFADSTCQAVLEAGIKANIGLTLFGGIDDTLKRCAENLEALEQAASCSNGLIHIDVAPHAVYTCTPETYRHAVHVAKEHGFGLHSHASETAVEVSRCRASYGKTPIAHLHSLGFLGRSTYLAHCVHPQDDDMAILADTGTVVVHNPSSNCKLASGVAPVTKLRTAGIPVALGTDGAASNNTLDMFREMRLAAMLASVQNGNPMAIPPYGILRMATVEGARALGRTDECGTLEVGKDADILLVDTRKAHLTPLNDPYSALVFAIASSDVDTTICKGNILMKNRILRSIDLQQVVDDAGRNWNRLTDCP